MQEAKCLLTYVMKNVQWQLKWRWPSWLGQNWQVNDSTTIDFPEDFRQRGGFTYESDIRATLNGFKFDESMWEMPISTFLRANTRLALWNVFLEKPELWCLTNRPNHLDIETTWLENYLVNYQERPLSVNVILDKVATVTLDLTRRSLDRYAGNYSKFMDL